MKQFIAIIGEAKSGKSTIIRSLTGCPTKDYRDFIRDGFSNESLYVVCGSPQEQSMSLEDLKALLNVVCQDSSCRGIVMAIQPKLTRSRLSMEKILQEVAVTESFQTRAFFVNPGRVSGPADSSVISRVNDLVVQPYILDGRRFAIINAEAVNRVTLRERPLSENVRASTVAAGLTLS